MECFQQEAITDATLLPNMKDTLEAIQIAKQYDLPIGLHLNLTEGPPIAPTDQVASLLDNGYVQFQKSLISKEHSLENFVQEKRLKKD